MLKLRSKLPVLFSAFFLGLVVFLALNWMAVFDWVRLQGYAPPQDIAQIATATKMTEKGRNLFYVHRPSVESDKISFNGHCSDSEKTIVLGCYIRGGGIYLYEVGDERLTGVVEVTAAHEMLHAAYDRLKKSERSRINELLSQAFSKLDNERIISTVESYREADPSSVPNELHSILGSEVRVLTPELEEYYSRYFSDRQSVVAMAEGYEQAFTSRETQREEYDRQLEAMKVEINTLNSSLTEREQTIAEEYDELVKIRDSGQISVFNARIASYNRSVNLYNADVRAVQELIKRYNTVVEERNKLVVEENQLIQALDSRSSTIETQ